MGGGSVAPEEEQHEGMERVGRSGRELGRGDLGALARSGLQQTGSLDFSKCHSSGSPR